MAKHTLSQVYDAARAKLGDDSVAGGQVFTNTVLAPHFAQAYRALYRTMGTLGNPYVEQDVYFVLPANTSYLAPATAGVTDFGEPRFVEERGGLTQKTITNAVAGSGFVTITAASHGFSTGDLITCNGIVGLDGTEGVLWAITVVDANSFKLNGCVGTGTYSTGGTAVKSAEKFVPVTFTDRMESIGGTSDRLRVYVWEGDAFHFNPTTEARQLRISYTASGNAPTNTSTVIGIDDAIDFLAVYSAGLAGRARGHARGDVLIAEALGPTMQEDASGGMLRSFLLSAVRTLQRIPPENRRRMPFRDPRSAHPMIF